MHALLCIQVAKWLQDEHPQYHDIHTCGSDNFGQRGECSQQISLTHPLPIDYYMFPSPVELCTITIFTINIHISCS